MSQSNFSRRTPPQSKAILAILVFSQFCGTSLWFAGNAAVRSLESVASLPIDFISYLTAAVQTGFIAGTLFVTVSGLADRIAPSSLFFFSCIGGALTNCIPLLSGESLGVTLASRFFTGVFLGGVYPVGMKIAADWQEQGLGDWLGALVGALVFGTALPHALASIDGLQHATAFLPIVSLIACLGGSMVYILVPEGPYRRKNPAFSLAHLKRAFGNKPFRGAMFGYLGHMWELYTFWAMVPWILLHYSTRNGWSNERISLYAAAIIAAGGIGCWLGGKISRETGSLAVARTALIASGLCCVASAFTWQLDMPWFIGFLCLWGFVVVADSPQFSALIARNAPTDTRGSALTLATCLGFSITIGSIQVLNWSAEFIPADYLLWLLIPGPAFGLVFSNRSAQPDNVLNRT